MIGRAKAAMAELLGLFVEDKILAALVLATVALAALFRDALRLGPAVTAFTLLGGCIGAVIFCVWRMARIRLG